MKRATSVSTPECSHWARADTGAVTKEEAVWESFSEDEPQPKRAKSAPKPAEVAKGKAAGKKGQGSIASFFKKA